MAKKAGKKDGKKERKVRAKTERALLELGDDLLTAVHLHHSVQEDEVRAALASAHADLVQAAGDLVARIARRFLEESGMDSAGRDRYAQRARGVEAASADELDAGTRLADQQSAPH